MRDERPNSGGNHYLLRMLAMLLLPVVVFTIAACDSGGGAAKPGAAYEGVPEGKPTNLGQPVPDPIEVIETKPAGQLPAFLDKVTGPAHDRVVSYYQGAVAHYDEYGHIPCYCGCAVYTTAHTSLASCFIKEKKADGSIAFTDHSTSCDLCGTAAEMTIEGIGQNKPLKDVRAGIFDALKYTGIWTDTPPVQ